jgi:hypothetical protein
MPSGRWLWRMNDESGHSPKRGFRHAAANASLAMPLIAILFAGVWQTYGIGGSKAFLGLLCMLCIGLGVLFAVVALCNVGRVPGGAWRGVLGLLFNGIFVAIFGLAFVAGFSERVKARQTERELARAAQTLREKRSESFDPGFGTTNANAVVETRVREQFEKAGTELKGQNPLLEKAWAVYAREVEITSGKWKQIHQQVAAARVLNFSELNGKQELRERQALVRRYKVTSDAMRHLVVNSADFFREELNKLGASPGQREAAVKTLQAQLAHQAPVLLQIRDLDTRISDDMLGILSLLETNWGSWSCRAGTMVFEDARTQREYNELLADLKTAGQEQIAAQRKLVSARQLPVNDF